MPLSGGDNYKRGDLALAHGITSDRNFDVHMAKTGANLSCQSCHTVKNHKIAGRGSDLRQTDLNVQMSCSTSACHPNKLSSNGHANADVNRHINKVACQTCHIKTFARNAADTPATEATEMHRDWFKPHQTPSGAIHPTPTLVNNVKPVYKFWNMYSYGYSLGEPISIDPQTGKYPTSRPDGGINDPGSKLYPFKYKTANQPLATNLNKLIPLDTSVYFATGDPHAATKAGLVNMGASPNEPYSFIETDTYQLITHQVMPKAQSLTCNQCHGATATQMNLKSMGYGMKASASSLCAQCHSYKDPAKMDYNSMHKKHVKDKKLDCSKCHNFTRVASATQYTLTIAKSGNGTGTVASNPAGINCGSDCTENYTQNAVVTLTASPSSGSTFAGWSGACSGGGTCVLTMNSPTNVTATFIQSTSTTCSFSISPESISINSSASSGNVSINTQAGCAWSATSNDSWITITSGSTGSGNGTLNYSVSANTSNNSRTGTLTIAGKTFTITQSGIANYALSGTVTSTAGTPLAGVTMTLSGSTSASTKTDSNGNYSFKSLANGNYTITPSFSGYSFTPASRAITISNANISGLNFSGVRTR